MLTVEEFLAHAVRLERDAAERFGQLGHAMEMAGNAEVAKLFHQLSHYSRMHLNDARLRASWREIPDLEPDGYDWPDIESPETAEIWAADPLIGRGQALEIALAAETAGFDYYERVRQTSTDPEVIVFAKEFADEERQHVAELKRWIAAHEGGEAMPDLAI